MREEVDSLKAIVAEIQALPQIQRWIAANRPLDVSIDVASAPALGAEDAPITLIEFSDYQCPYCARHVNNTLPDLKKKYVESGKVKYVFMDYPLRNHSLAPKASEAAHCAGEQDKYWEMHDELFANRTKLKIDDLRSHAAAIGLDTDAFNECLDSDKYALIIKKHFQIGSDKVHVTGTPSFGIGFTSNDGKSVQVVKSIKGAKSLAAFEKEIDELLEKAG
jgi:protein-disulfide isomerase